VLIEDIVYYDDGTPLRGVFTYDEATSRACPGILVVHEAWGLGKHALDRAKMLVGLGYAVFAADMYGDRRFTTVPQEATALAGHLRAEPARLRARIGAALRVLVERPQVDPRRLGAIGFCFGGTTVLELARSGAELSGVVSFHGGLLPIIPAEPGSIRASVMVCAGADDPLNPPEQIAAFEEEMRAARADYQVLIYGDTLHSFTNPDADGVSMPGRMAYSPRSDRRSWLAMRQFFEEVFSDAVHN
jgi:dienelactone hydrolase